MSWIEHGERENTPKRVLWLSGPAGSGKTAIAGTIADECHKKGLLAASFFFSAFAGSIDPRLSKNVISTLLYGLLEHKQIIGLKAEVLAVLEDDPIVFERRLDQQLERLVLKPLRKVTGRSDRCHWPRIIIVDSLDECEGGREADIGDSTSSAKAQNEILSALLRACTDSAFPFRIMISSRPEPVIRHFFTSSLSPIHRIFLDDKYDPDSDIRLFLGAMFNDLRRRFNLPSVWAAKDVVDILVKESSGQFIYAATVIRFLDNPRLGPPQQLLTQVLEWRSLNDSNPFAPLDLLYDRVFRASADPLTAAKWIRFINNQRDALRDALYLQCMLESYTGETEHVLGTLTSLVGLVDENGKPGFHFYHKSLLDFLGDPHRSFDLYINKESLDHFTKDRYYQTLRGVYWDHIFNLVPYADTDAARGPQSKAPDSPTRPSPLFSTDFCFILVHFIDPDLRYTSEDVEWWLSTFREPRREKDIPWMFSSIHRQVGNHFSFISFPQKLEHRHS
jgi:hypothetical protein